MEKQKTTVRVAGKEYTLLSDDPPAYLHRVAAFADRKLQEMTLASRLPAASANVLAAINLADELLKAQDENSRLRRELARLHEELDMLRRGTEKNDE